jgi:hypothetical protein
MVTVSFDFDGTLSRTDVQEFAKDLKKAGHRIIITTNRYQDRSNADLKAVAKSVGIKEHLIFYCNMLGKHRFLSPAHQVTVHCDDDWIDCEMVEHECGIPTVKMFGNPDWKKQILEIISK